MNLSKILGKIYNFIHQFTIVIYSLNCTEILKLCSFAGVEFDCCENIRSVITDVGECFQFDFSAVDSINHKQKQIGVRSG